MSYAKQFLAEAGQVIKQLDAEAVDHLAEELVAVRERGGRLFALGVGGGAGHASHAVADFRKLCSIEAYAPTDNVSELSARVNDDGWDSTFSEWLKVSRLGPADMLFVFSVGGGNVEHDISPNLVRALDLARTVGATVAGVVGRDGGYTAEVADVCVIVPTINPESVTPHTESVQALIWHLLVSHPTLQKQAMKWESIR
jgi:D-sedoheptulose 7-phosphate isomerase